MQILVQIGWMGASPQLFQLVGETLPPNRFAPTFGGCRPWRNHVCKVWKWNLQGLRFYRGWIFASPIDSCVGLTTVLLQCLWYPIYDATLLILGSLLLSGWIHFFSFDRHFSQLYKLLLLMFILSIAYSLWFSEIFDDRWPVNFCCYWLHKEWVNVSAGGFFNCYNIIVPCKQRCCDYLRGSILLN